VKMRASTYVKIWAARTAAGHVTNAAYAKG